MKLLRDLLNYGAIIMATMITLAPTATLAIGSTDLQAITNDTNFYDPDASCSGGATTTGTLPSTVPAPYNAIFTAAAQATGVDPILLASIFYTENRGFPNPPPPYGTGSPWPVSPAGAEGPFQFLPSTWSAYGQGGNINDLKDAAAGAGRFLVSLGGKNGIPLGDPTNPRAQTPSISYVLAAYNAGPAGNFDNSETIQYVQIGTAIYQKLSGGKSNSGGGNSGSVCTGGAAGANGSIVSVARSQLGTHEWTSETDSTPGGCNCGGGVQPNGRTVDSYTNNNPEFWCADFVSWVYWKAGLPFSGGAGPSWKIASAIGIVDYMKAHGTWIPNGPNAQPQPGMIVYFNFTDDGATGGSDDHIGIVDHVSGNTLYTIEGNAANQVLAVTYPNFRTTPSNEIIGFGGLNQ